MPDTDLSFKSATELGRMLRERKISSVELTRLFLDRLKTLGPRYNALATLTAATAVAQARRADQRLRRGDNTWPLLGVPYGAKDLLATKGIPTRWGSPAHRHQTFAHDATVIQKLRDAGAVLAGKLAMVELAGGGGYEYASASADGPGLNPWNVRHWAGGSSSGSGSAVAAGLVPYALGSETWGSIVTPSGFCGITGLRPTWGLVSRYGAMELAWSMDKIGPMARTAEDCGWILQAITGTDRHDPTTTAVDHRSTGFAFNPRIERRAFRLGILPADFSHAPELERAFKAAVRILRSAGMRVTRAELPAHPYAKTARRLLNGEMAAAHAEFIRSKKLGKLVDAGQKRGLRASMKLTASDHIRAEQRRLEMKRDVLGVFEKFDALVSPSLMTEAVTLETNLKTLRRRRGNYGVLGALCGVPALSVPMGFGRHGLPLGLAITGNLLSEATLLQIGMIFQRETDWHQRHPPEVS
ncbi:MAG: amidase [Armatimonadota bacterium]